MKSDDVNDGIGTSRIYGRTGFFEKAKKLISENDSGYYVISCINIDNFKAINAQYGTSVGDMVLLHVANCIEKCMNEIGGIVGHIAGDDFAVLYPVSYSTSKLIEESYYNACSPECIFQSMRLRIGRCIVNSLFVPVSEMYDNAKLASNAIREDYEKNIEYYSDYMRSDLMERQQIINDMGKALKSDRFEVWLQPQYNHATGAVIGAEVLARWNRNGTYVMPKVFIPIFEQNGFIYRMDKYIWEASCKLLRKWIDSGKSVLPLSVNVSRRDLLHDDFISFMAGLIKKYDISPELLRLEITEYAFSGSSKIIIEKVKKLIELGFTVEIDDFGSGYSSLNTLKDVPATVIKLDMRFFESTNDNRRAGNIIESIVRMAKLLGMAVIAEGVEDKELADYLKSIGCYYIQGYFYAKPMCVKDYETLIENSEKERKLSRLKTLETFDNNEFWNPKSMDSLIFNSYVGGACIFEYYKDKTCILRLNDRYISELGGIIEEGTKIYGTAISKYMDVQCREKFFNTVRKAIDTHKEASCEVKLVNENQTEYVRVAIRALARTDDRVLCYAAVANMTELRMAEINERNIEKQLDTMMSSIHASVTATLYNGRDNIKVLYKNKGFYNLFGYTKEQFETELSHANDLILPEDLNKAMSAVEQVVTTKRPLTHEFRAKKRNGDIIWVQITNSVVNLDSIGDNVLMGVAMDVTYLHKLKDREAETSDKLRAVLNNADNGITAAYSENGRVKLIIANDKFYKMHGVKKTEDGYIPNDMLLNVIYEEDKETARNIAKDAIRNRKSAVIEYRIIQPQNKIRWIRAAINTTRITGIDKPVQIAIFSDITEGKEHNSHLKFLNKTAHEILSQPDFNIAINATLEKIINYFKGERAYIFETDFENKTIKNTFELCAKDAASTKSSLQKIPIELVGNWYKQFEDNKIISIENVDKSDNIHPGFKKTLLSHNVHSLVISPLWRDGNLIGFAGVDNPKGQSEYISNLAAIGDYLAVLITRRDLTMLLNDELNKQG